MRRPFMLLFFLPHLAMAQWSLPRCITPGVKHNCVGAELFGEWSYVGEFQNAEWDGEGVLYDADGKVLQAGRWKSGKLVGYQAIDPSRYPTSLVSREREAIADRTRAAEAESRKRADAVRQEEADRRRFTTSFDSPTLRALQWKERLDRVVRAEIAQWLMPNAVGLEEIPPPIYPAALAIRQEAWETDKEFEVRVESARRDRRAVIERLQADYRTKVELRNKRVAEHNKLVKEREAQLPARRRELLLAGIRLLAPVVVLSDIALDQQGGTLTISAGIDGIGKQSFAFAETPQNFRRSALTETTRMKGTAEFDVSASGEIFVKALLVEAGGSTARGIPASSNSKPTQLASVTIPAQTPQVAQQSPVTVDRNQVEQILYREENELLRKRLEEQRKLQEQAVAAAEVRAAQEIARIRAETQQQATDFRPSQHIAQIREAHALVIGNGAYPGSGRLDNPVRDAQAISAKLRSMGFRVTEVSNTSRDQMVRSLSDFTKSAARADLTLLFYAGHGIQVQGVNYMIPVDMSLNDPSQATLQGVSLTQAVEQYLPGKTKLVFLDACRDNPLLVSSARGVSKGLAPINVSEGTLISYATKDGQTAADGVGSKNSPFTAALLEHIDEPQDIGVVLRKVREKVMLATGGKQQPWEYGSLTGGELVLARIKAPPSR